MPDLKPFRSLSPHETVNFFGMDNNDTNKGTFVRITTAFTDQDNPELLGAVGASFNNTLSERWGVTARVTAAASGNTDIFGMTVYDVKETDENGELYKFNPRKAIENQVILSGQAVPLAKRGLFSYIGIEGTPTAGAPLYVSGNGTLMVAKQYGTQQQVATALGGKNSRDGATVVFVDVR